MSIVNCLRFAIEFITIFEQKFNVFIFLLVLSALTMKLKTATVVAKKNIIKYKIINSFDQNQNSLPAQKCLP